jgi:NADPH:quinone reductase-like Zn-dependent oxidoreductase
MLGFPEPRNPIQGLWLSGQIEKNGNSVTKFKEGQEIYARSKDLKFGANAEYICLPETAMISVKPRNLSFEEAVSLPFGGLTALYFLRKSKIKPDDKILIYGASGSVGSSAVQLAKHTGAKVTAVCSTENIDWVNGLGADNTIDYKKEKFADCGKHFDIVFDAVGYFSKSEAIKILKPDGRFISVISSGHAKLNPGELNYLTELAEKGHLKPVVDRCFPFEGVKEAHRYVDLGHKKGNVVLRVNE